MLLSRHRDKLESVTSGPSSGPSVKSQCPTPGASISRDVTVTVTLRSCHKFTGHGGTVATHTRVSHGAGLPGLARWPGLNCLVSAPRAVRADRPGLLSVASRPPATTPLFSARPSDRHGPQAFTAAGGPSALVVPTRTRPSGSATGETDPPAA